MPTCYIQLLSYRMNARRNVRNNVKTTTALTSVTGQSGAKGSPKLVGPPKLVIDSMGH